MKLRFMPQEERFFELFEQSAENVVKGAKLLLQLVSDSSAIEQLRNEIEEVEHEGDIITHEIADRLNRTFITPFDHEDIHDLAGRMDDILDNIRGVIREHYPSFRLVSRWEGRELRVILENDLAFVTVSDYCGMIAVCLVPSAQGHSYADSTENFAESWCRRISNNWCERLNKAFNGLRKLGTFSNGECVFEGIGK